MLALPQGLRGTGRIEVTVTADSANAVPEANAGSETNNSAVLTFTSAATPYADLTVTDLQAPATARGGRERHVQLDGDQHRLRGRAAAVVGPARPQPRTPSSATATSIVLATVVHTGGLAPARATPPRRPWRRCRSRLTGTWYVSVVADVLAQVTEPDTRANNTLLPPVPIALTSPFADLQVEVAVAPAQVTEGTPIALSWRIRNAGDGTTARRQWSDAVVPLDGLDARRRRRAARPRHPHGRRGRRRQLHRQHELHGAARDRPGPTSS